MELIPLHELKDEMMETIIPIETIEMMETMERIETIETIEKNETMETMETIEKNKTIPRNEMDETDAFKSFVFFQEQELIPVPLKMKIKMKKANKISGRVKTACARCRQAKTACNLLRPCTRCIKLGKGESCINAGSKSTSTQQTFGDYGNRINKRTQRANKRTRNGEFIDDFTFMPSLTVNSTAAGPKAASPRYQEIKSDFLPVISETRLEKQLEIVKTTNQDLIKQLNKIEIEKKKSIQNEAEKEKPILKENEHENEITNELNLLSNICNPIIKETNRLNIIQNAIYIILMQKNIIDLQEKELVKNVCNKIELQGKLLQTCDKSIELEKKSIHFQQKSTEFENESIQFQQKFKELENEFKESIQVVVHLLSEINHLKHNHNGTIDLTKTTLKEAGRLDQLEIPVSSPS